MQSLHTEPPKLSHFWDLDILLVFHHLCWQISKLGMWGLLCPHPTGIVGGVCAMGGGEQDGLCGPFQPSSMIPFPLVHEPNCTVPYSPAPRCEGLIPTAPSSSSSRGEKQNVWRGSGVRARHQLCLSKEVRLSLGSAPLGAGEQFLRGPW